LRPGLIEESAANVVDTLLKIDLIEESPKVVAAPSNTRRGGPAIQRSIGRSRYLRTPRLAPGNEVLECPSEDEP
jgi:hypothetical protein